MWVSGRDQGKYSGWWNNCNGLRSQLPSCFRCSLWVKYTLPIPIPGQATTVGAVVGYQVLWPTYLVNLSTKFIQVCYFHLQQFIKRRISFENMVLSFIGISKREKTKNKRKWIEKWWKPSRYQEFWCISRFHAKEGENTRCGSPKWCIWREF